MPAVIPMIAKCDFPKFEFVVSWSYANSFII